MKYFTWKNYTIPSEIFVTEDFFGGTLTNNHLIFEKLYKTDYMLRCLRINGKHLTKKNAMHLSCYQIIHDVNFVEMTFEKWNNLKLFL